MQNELPFAHGPGNRSMPEATVIPVLFYVDVPAAATWLCQAFGFVERLRIADHRVQLDIGQGAIVVARRRDAGQVILSAATASMMVRVSNVDLHCARARNARATVLSEPTSHVYGERQYDAIDIGGHLWTFSQTEADVDPAIWGALSVGPS
jgi:uncharacterized glyoxalase superfamily protein PhnB